MGIKKVLKAIFDYFGYEVRNKQSFPQKLDIPIDQIAQLYGPDVVQYMALTGAYSNECIERGVLPVAAHFYQPIPNLKDLEERNIWELISPMNGIEWDISHFIEYLKELSEYASECSWPNEPTGNPMDFHINNTCFSYGCATALHSMIRKYKPKRIIEVGSGNSSKVIAAAITANREESIGYSVNYSIIDPYSDIDVSIFPAGTELIKQAVERMDVGFFDSLEKNDLLFIDSSHTCKIGSDVNFEILDVLPTLKEGVFVHFHDIELPNEYSKTYAYLPTFRMFWTEAYLLQAFLIGNKDWEILLPLSWFQRNNAELFRELFPKGNDAVLWGSSSFWIRRKAD